MVENSECSKTSIMIVFRLFAIDINRYYDYQLLTDTRVQRKNITPVQRLFLQVLW